MSTSTMPSVLRVGQTIDYIASLADFPASDGWALRLVLNPRSGGTVITLDSSASDDDHLIQVGSATTSGWTAGDYGWEIWALGVGEQHHVESGQLTLLPSLLYAGAGTDTRTQAEVALADAKAALAAWTPTRRRYRIGDREMEFSSSAEIGAIISHWEHEVAREVNAERLRKGMKTTRKVFVRMGRA